MRDDLSKKSNFPDATPLKAGGGTGLLIYDDDSQGDTTPGDIELRIDWIPKRIWSGKTDNWLDAVMYFGGSGHAVQHYDTIVQTYPKADITSRTLRFDISPYFVGEDITGYTSADPYYGYASSGVCFAIVVQQRNVGTFVVKADSSFSLGQMGIQGDASGRVTRVVLA